MVQKSKLRKERHKNTLKNYSVETNEMKQQFEAVSRAALQELAPGTFAAPRQC